jgi:hypothetical protein
MRVRWHGHPAHFIGSMKCAFRLVTEIRHRGRGVVVSSIGDYFVNNVKTQVGANRFFETLVFDAAAAKHLDCGCPEIEGWNSQIDFAPANTAQEATDNHHAMVRKWKKVLRKESRRK